MNQIESDEILEEIPTFPESEGAPLRKLDYLGYAPCPIRGEMQRRMNAFFKQHEAESGPLAWFSPGGCGGANDPYDLIWKGDDADAMPGVISDGGSSDYFRREGHKRWIASGVYGPYDIPQYRLRPEFEAAGVADPLGALHLYAAFPSVFLVDMQRLGNRPMPRAWIDLCNPLYRGDVTISGWEDEVPDPILFNMVKNYGEDALSSFAKNVKNFWSPAQIAKVAGGSGTEGTAIYALSLFFAKGNPRDDRVTLVWPEDGAWFSPLTFLAKQQRRPVSQLPMDFLVSGDWARYLDGVGVPSAIAYPGQKPLPGRLAWMGWDFIRNNDIDVLRDKLNGVFQRARKE